MAAGSHRLHPLSPVARLGVAAGVALVIILENVPEGGLGVVGGLVIAAVVFVGLGISGALSWWFTGYRIEGDDLRVDTGWLFRRTRHVPLSRLQAVDIVRPVLARVLGLAELRLEVAGGGGSQSKLDYLSLTDAHVLRAQLLAMAAGLRPDEPEAPERVLVKVPVPSLVASILLTFPLAAAVVLLPIAVLVAVVTGAPEALVPFLPVLIGLPAYLWTSFAQHFDFTVAESPDGLRLRHGLLQTRAQTVPPGRVQSLRIVEPLLWRHRGWVRVQVNVAGYGGEERETQSQTSTLLPVAPRPVALSVIGRILPGIDVDGVPLSGVPERARWRRPFWWQGLACGADPDVFVARRGLINRQLDVIPHGKTQSVRLVQGPWLRRLRLATVHVDTTPGPVRVDAACRDAAEARAIVEEQVVRARTGRRAAGPERWMSTAPAPPDVS